MSEKIHIAITSGEPAGIGPEVSCKAALDFLKKYSDVQLSILGDESLFPQVMRMQPRLKLVHHALAVPNQLGKLNSKNADYVLSLLDEAFQGCIERRYDAMVTAPLQKSTINERHSQNTAFFSGHTEYLAEKANVSRVVMMLCGHPHFAVDKVLAQLRVALVTTHLPLQKVAQSITYAAVLETIQILHHDLKNYFGIEQPRIRVAGLNPHAGESGHLGREEIEIISPAIENAQQAGIQVFGPYPGDTIFDVKQLSQTDAILAMYHDQGLAPFKFATFGVGVNVTLGLPIIRTSVDHGTALDLAGKNQADAGSMFAALELAYELAINQRKGNQ